MKPKLIPLLLSALLLAGCSNSGSSSQSESSSQNKSVSSSQTESSSQAQAADADKYELGDVMPVLAIQTVSTDKKAIDFATKPVARHVAQSIASWTPGYKMPKAPYYEACTVTLTDKGGSTLIDSAPAQVKVRGNWTTTYNKKPYRIKFDEKQAMLDLAGGEKFKNWLLLAEYKDGSMLRNKSALAMADEILAKDGVFASDAAFVEVTINGSYFGVYLLCEYPQANKNRIDITKPEEGYEGTDIGYFLEYDGYYNTEEDLNGFKIGYNNDAKLTPYDGEGGKRQSSPLSGGQNKVGISIKSDIYSQEQHDFIAGFVDNVYNIMYHAAYDNKAYVFNDDFSEIKETSDITPEEAVRRVVDVDSLADMYIVSELTCDADIYWSSFFMYADFGEGGSKKLTFGDPWDFDSGLGNKDRCASGEGFYAANIVYDVNDRYASVNPWLTVLMYQDWYTDIIRDKWTAAYDDGVFERGIQMIKDDTANFAAAFDRNYEKWDNIRHNEAGNELCRAAAACKTQAECAEYLASWLTTRVEFLNGQWHK